MPKLSNPRHEAFAALIAGGSPVIDAYLAAGFAPQSRPVAGTSGRKLLNSSRVLARIEELKLAGHIPQRMSDATKHAILASIACSTDTPVRDRIAAIIEDNKLSGSHPTARERDAKVKAAIGDQGNVIQPGSRAWSVALQAARQLRNRAAPGEADAAQDNLDDDVDDQVDDQVDTRGPGALPAGSTLPS